MNNTILIIAIAVCVLIFLTFVLVVIALSRENANAAKLSARIEANNSAINQRMDSYFNSYGEMVANNQRAMSEQQDVRLKALEESLARMRSDNNERLEQVYKGLGEMQSVANNVGDLKKILSNVKTRGILGEVQLAAILEQILNHDQYDENVATIKGSSERVEFAIKLPGDGEDSVYLPIDSKFPGDCYSALMDAYETGDKALVDKAKASLRSIMKTEAKDIRNKYVAPPDTTDFGIMFLPFEGLYAEAVNMGMVEELQRDYKVTIAGPTTMAALLNSLQMGFNTLAIEKKSSEVWKVLSEVKKEFELYEEIIKSARTRIRQADDELDKLEGVRTRAINRKLRDVTSLEEEKSDILKLDD